MAALGQLTVLTAPTRSFHCQRRGVSVQRGRGDVVVLKAQSSDFIQKEKSCNFYFRLNFAYISIWISYICRHTRLYSYISSDIILNYI